MAAAAIAGHTLGFDKARVPCFTCVVWSLVSRCVFGIPSWFCAGCEFTSRLMFVLIVHFVSRCCCCCRRYRCSCCYRICLAPVQTQARLVADPSLTAHVIDIVVDGPTGADGSTFRVTTERYNPAAAGAVTGNATYASFLSSLLNVGGRGSGVHMC